MKICGTIIRSRSMFFYKKVIDKTNDTGDYCEIKDKQAGKGNF